MIDWRTDSSFIKPYEPEPVPNQLWMRIRMGWKHRWGLKLRKKLRIGEYKVIDYHTDLW